MPTYEHACSNDACKHEWDDTYSIKVEPPKVCPKCGLETAKRLISLGGKGVVELSGQDLLDKLKTDTKQLKKDMNKSENVYANLLGESKYQDLQSRMDRRKRDKY
jgi:putative FmdB family regulatory protein